MHKHVLGLVVLLAVAGCSSDMPTVPLPTASVTSVTTVLVVSDEASCAALPIATTWSTGNCALGEDLTLSSGGGLTIQNVRLTVPAGRVLTNDGGAITVVFGGLFRIQGTLLNTAGGAIQSSGFWDVRDGGAITNQAGSTIQTSNQLHVTPGTLTNAGTLTNTQFMSVDGTVTNSGTLTNSGTIHVDRGTFNNSGTVNNNGTIEVGCGGAFTNSGTLNGNPTSMAFCWRGGNGPLWSTPANWNTNSVPTGGERIIIQSTTGPELDVSFTLTGILTLQLATLTVRTTAALTNQGTIQLGLGGQLPGTAVIRNNGTLTNNATLNNNDLLVNNGTVTNNATIEPSSVVGILENGGLFINASGAFMEGGLRGVSGGELRNSGTFNLNRSTNSNAGVVSNRSGGTLNVNNALANTSGGRIENDGTLNITHALTFAGRIDNAAGATIVNHTLLAITDGESALNNDGRVENTGTIENGGIIQNDGVLCGAGVVNGNGVLGNAPRVSCNEAPVASAGPDQSATRSSSAGALFSLNGTGSSDPDGAIPTYQWFEGTNLVATGATASVTLSSLGAHTITLRVTDDDGATDEDQITLTVLNAAPVAAAGADQALTRTGPAGAAFALDGTGSSDADGSITGYQWREGSTGVATGATPSVTLAGLGPHTITLRVTDSDGATNEDDVTLTVLNALPAAEAGPDQVVECTGPLNTVTLDGAGSSDPDGSIAGYDWFEAGQHLAMGATPEVHLPLGTHQLTLRVTDSDGAIAEDQVMITVQDTQAPSVHLAMEVSSLWPPNHQMVRVAIGISASDTCDPAPGLAVTVTSNEPGNETGNGDVAPDWQVVRNADGTVDVWVRAERRGNGSGRVYTITAIASDASGNTTTASGIVTVPRNR